MIYYFCKKKHFQGKFTSHQLSRNIVKFSIPSRTNVTLGMLYKQFIALISHDFKSNAGWIIEARDTPKCNSDMERNRTTHIWIDINCKICCIWFWLHDAIALSIKTCDWKNKCMIITHSSLQCQSLYMFVTSEQQKRVDYRT